MRLLLLICILGLFVVLQVARTVRLRLLLLLLLFAARLGILARRRTAICTIVSTLWAR